MKEIIIHALGDRSVVFSDPSEETIYTWDREKLLQVWVRIFYGWMQVDRRILIEKPPSYAHAKDIAGWWAKVRQIKRGAHPPTVGSL